MILMKPGESAGGWAARKAGLSDDGLGLLNSVRLSSLTGVRIKMAAYYRASDEPILPAATAAAGTDARAPFAKRPSVCCSAIAT